MSEFKPYLKTAVTYMRPYVEGEELDSRVSVSEADREDGCPKLGDMIARNPGDHGDMWLINGTYFAENYREASCSASSSLSVHAEA